MNAEAGITRCTRCEIDLRRILNTGVYAAGRLPGSGDADAAGGAAGEAQQQAAAAGGGAEQQAGAVGDGSEQQPCGDAQCSDPGHHHHHHPNGGSNAAHDGRVGTVTITLPPGRAVDLARVRAWLDGLLWEGTADAVDLFRIKGLLHVAGSGRKHILQGVHELYDIVEGAAWGPAEPCATKLVFIGRHLRRDALQADLHACLADDEQRKQ